MAALRRLQTAASLRCPIASARTPRPPGTPSGDLSETLTRPTRSPSHDLPLRFLHCRRTITSTEPEFFLDRRQSQYSTMAVLRRVPTASIKALGPSRSLSSSTNPSGDLPLRSLLWRFVTSNVPKIKLNLERRVSETKPSAAAESPPLKSKVDMEELVKEERKRVEELLEKRGLQKGSYPNYWVQTFKNQIGLQMNISPACDIPDLIGKVVGQLGVKAGAYCGNGSDIKLRAWNNKTDYGLRITPPGRDQGPSAETDKEKGKFDVLLYRRYDNLDKTVLYFVKECSYSSKELDAFIDVLLVASGKLGEKVEFEKKQRDEALQKSISSLQEMGVKVYGLDAGQENSSSDKISWDNIAGYDQQKREIEDVVLLALKSPCIYDDIARETRYKFESNRPRAILFEGPPGTGKTSFARVIASQAGVPLLYVPLESIVSKWYGESSRSFGKLFSLANELANGAIVFLDEIDSFACSRSSRSNYIHEETRRMLSVLLHQIDGFEQDKKVILIGATNRKEDLDPALLSRFDTTIYFGLPDEQSRREIAAKYAKHLTENELVEFSQAMEEMSGRDIRDVCQQAERSWASKIIRGEEGNGDGKKCLPPVQEYIDSAVNRQKSLRDAVSKDKSMTTFFSRGKN